jgi:hypothetical protein
MDTSYQCKEQDFEICAIQLVTKTSNVTILSLYRAPSDVNEYLRRLDATLKYLYYPKSEFITCGDINYLNANSHKKQVLFIKDVQFVIRCEFCNKNSKFLKYSH